jgi:hypothetical protein
MIGNESLPGRPGSQSQKPVFFPKGTQILQHFRQIYTRQFIDYSRFCRVNGKHLRTCAHFRLHSRRLQILPSLARLGSTRQQPSLASAFYLIVA